MINLHQQFISFFDKYDCSREEHPDGKGVNATVPANLGPLPVTVRYSNKKPVVMRVFVPIRITEGKITLINELVSRFNHTQIRPQLVLDYDRRLMYSTSNTSIKEVDNEPDWIDLLLAQNLRQLDAVFDSLTAVLYRDISPELALEEFKKEYGSKPKNNHSKNRVVPERLRGISGGDPQLN